MSTIPQGNTKLRVRVFSLKEEKKKLLSLLGLGIEKYDVGREGEKANMSLDDLVCSLESEVNELWEQVNNKTKSKDRLDEQIVKMKNELQHEQKQNQDQAEQLTSIAYQFEDANVDRENLKTANETYAKKCTALEMEAEKLKRHNHILRDENKELRERLSFTNDSLQKVKLDKISLKILQSQSQNIAEDEVVLDRTKYENPITKNIREALEKVKCEYNEVCVEKIAIEDTLHTIQNELEKSKRQNMQYLNDKMEIEDEANKLCMEKIQLEDQLNHTRNKLIQQDRKFYIDRKKYEDQIMVMRQKLEERNDTKTATYGEVRNQQSEYSTAETSSLSILAAKYGKDEDNDYPTMLLVELNEAGTNSCDSLSNFIQQ